MSGTLRSQASETWQFSDDVETEFKDAGDSICHDSGSSRREVSNIRWKDETNVESGVRGTKPPGRALRAFVVTMVWCGLSAPSPALTCSLSLSASCVSVCLRDRICVCLRRCVSVSVCVSLYFRVCQSVPVFVCTSV